MSKTNATKGLKDRLQRAVARLLGMSDAVRSRDDRRLAPLQELEDRRLLSGTPGFTIMPASGTAPTTGNFVQTSKAGASGSFTVALASAPTNTVTLNLTSADPAEGTLSSPSLTFTASNWNVAQTVRVTGMNDGVNSNTVYAVNGTSTSSDANYNNLAMPAVTIANFYSSTTTLNISESGTSASYTFDLPQQPSSNVTVQYIMSVPNEALLSASSLTFTPTNWNVPQSVTVTGTGNNVVNGNQDFLITGVLSSTDAAFNGVITNSPVAVAVAGYTVAPTSLTTTDTGTSASFAVALTAAPTATVTLDLGTTVAGQGSLSQSSLTFNASNWNVAQNVTVTGLDDHIVDGNQTYQITGTATSTDPNYGGSAMTPVTVTNINTNVAGINVAPTSIQTSMAGASASFNVVLSSLPGAPVTITLNNGNPTDGTLSRNTLTFNASDWNIAQSVTVTGQLDLLAGANVTYQITGTATSGDANYNNLAIAPVTVTNVDTILPGFIVSPTTLTTSQSGTSASFTVALTTLPLLPVTVNLTNSDPTQGSLSQSSLTFTLLNWNTPQSVTVTGLNDHIADGNQTYQITGTATSLDLLYNNLAITPVTVTNINTNVAGINVAPTSIQTSMAGASAAFNVVLTSEPLAPVTIALNGDPTDGALSTNTLTFNASNWNVAQTVTVTGQNDPLAGANVTYQITGTARSGDANYNNLATAPVTVTNVDTASSTSIISSGNASYGQAVTFTATVSAVVPALGTPTGTVTFVEGTTDLATVSLTAGTAVYTTSALSAGSHDITANYSGDPAFFASTATLTQDITPATLTISADNASKVYGQTVVFAGTEFTTSGLVNSDTVSGVTLTSAGAAATATVSGAPYAITVSAATGTGLSNYSINYVDGSLAVTPATLTVTANDASKVYGQTVFFAGTEFTTNGLVNSDTVSGVTLTSAGAAATATVSSSPYAIAASAATGTGLSNYSINYADGSLTVTPATLTITANSTSKTYGQTLVFAGTEFTASGLVNSDAVSGVTLTSAGSTTTATVSGSPYVIAAGAATGNGLGNYNISYVNGTLTVTTATLTVTANDASKVYGQTVVFAGTEFTTSGLVNSDAVSGVTLTSAGAAATATVSSSPYVIAAGAATGAGLSNYSINYVSGSLSVTPATLTVTADNASKVYGQTVVFAGTEFTTSGMVNSDAVSGVTLTSAGAATTATVSGAPYAITASAATGSGLSNYNINYVDGSLTVTPATLTITANSTSKTYGQTLVFAGTEFTANGLVNSDAVSGVTLTSAGAAATASVPGAPYVIAAGAATGNGLGNYNISYVNGTLTVTPATLTVTADNASKVYGQADPVFTATLTGFVNSDSSAVVSGNAKLSTTATTGSGVGSYTITAGPGSLSAANYTFAFANGTLTVSPANGTPAPPTLTGVILLVPGTLPSNPAVGGSAGAFSAPLPTSALLNGASNSALFHATTGPSNEVPTDFSLILLSDFDSSTRTIQVFSPIPHVSWQQTQIVSVPEIVETPLDVLVSQISNSSQARAAQSDDGLDMLNDEGERVPWTETGLETTMVIGTGVIAASGYVLLNSRLGLWLLGLLTSQPLWKQFDPLEVLYAWEEEDRVTEDQEEETLLSLVD